MCRINLFKKGTYWSGNRAIKKRSLLTIGDLERHVNKWYIHHELQCIYWHRGMLWMTWSMRFWSILSHPSFTSFFLFARVRNGLFFRRIWVSCKTSLQGIPYIFYWINITWMFGPHGTMNTLALETVLNNVDAVTWRVIIHEQKVISDSSTKKANMRHQYFRNVPCSGYDHCFKHM